MVLSSLRYRHLVAHGIFFFCDDGDNSEFGYIFIYDENYTAPGPGSAAFVPRSRQAINIKWN
jgi:hypothetical protein